MEKHKYLSNFDFCLYSLKPFLACYTVSTPFYSGNMACCASGGMSNLKHNKPLLFGVWFIKLGINIT